eukprot:gnl/Chilomastix_cuspidata/3374.p1 GENE.gnl/Chilomastix_cuspidata/3374~~gnl/Chilomastix_cuspidata/3374.p1  ORF type:complete len:498 (-),score=200.89 gnl/Chilomastix_cuspidata/3374:376-1869(-)
MYAQRRGTQGCCSLAFGSKMHSSPPSGSMQMLLAVLLLVTFVTPQCVVDDRSLFGETKVAKVNFTYNGETIPSHPFAITMNDYNFFITYSNPSGSSESECGIYKGNKTMLLDVIEDLFATDASGITAINLEVECFPASGTWHINHRDYDPGASEVPAIASASAISVDNQGRLWVLDQGVGADYPPRLLVFDISDLDGAGEFVAEDNLVAQYAFELDTSTSFFSDIVIDSTHSLAYIADASIRDQLATGVAAAAEGAVYTYFLYQCPHAVRYHDDDDARPAHPYAISLSSDGASLLLADFMGTQLHTLDVNVLLAGMWRIKDFHQVHDLPDADVELTALLGKDEKFVLGGSMSNSSLLLLGPDLTPFSIGAAGTTQLAGLSSSPNSLVHDAEYAVALWAPDWAKLFTDRNVYMSFTYFPNEPRTYSRAVTAYIDVPTAVAACVIAFVLTLVVGFFPLFMTLRRARHEENVGASFAYSESEFYSSSPVLSSTGPSDDAF